MKLVRREQLMLLPAGTLYMQHAFDSCRRLLVKGETISWDGQNIDWFVDARVPGGYDGFAYDQAPANLMSADSSCTPDAVGDGFRDGMFDDESVYIAFEQSDVEGVIDLMKGCLAKAYGGAQ